MFCLSSAVDGVANAVMTELAPPGPRRVGGVLSSLAAKSSNCFTRYSWGWLDRFGLAGIVLLPAAPWQLAQARIPRAASPFAYSCSPLAASGFATATSAAYARDTREDPSSKPLATTILESTRFMKTSTIAIRSRCRRHHDGQHQCA